MKSTRSISRLILFNAWMILIAGNTCPYDKPCICEKLKLYCKELQTMPQLQTGADVINVTQVTFEGGTITDLSGYSLPPCVFDLELKDLPLTTISDDALGDTLTALSIKTTALTELPKALLQLKNLITLNIQDTFIDNWNLTILQHLGNSVLELTLQNVSLSSWPTWISLFQSLKLLDLARNPIKFIPDEAFRSVENTLEELYLDSTGLTLIPVTANLSRLNVLYLLNNQISDVTSDRLTSSIRDLDLTSNYIKEITDTSFPNPSSIVLLVLKSNPISKISKSAFNPLVNITDLTLYDTNLTEVPLAVTSLTKLKSFSMISRSPLSCPCPQPKELVQWYKSYNGTLTLYGNCAHFVGYDAYLSGDSCDATTTKYITTTLASNSTKSNNSAIPLASCLRFAHVSFIFILTICISVITE